MDLLSLCSTSCANPESFFRLVQLFLVNESKRQVKLRRTVERRAWADPEGVGGVIGFLRNMVRFPLEKPI